MREGGVPARRAVVEPAPAPMRALLIEDDEDDYLLTSGLLDRAPGSRFHLEWASTYEAGRDAVLTGNFDICLLDFQLGARTGLELLEEIAPLGCRTPIILLTGQWSHETDLAALRAGAADYLVKGEVTARLLGRAVRYARERSALLEQIRALSVTDELTGLHNRRGFNRLAEHHLRQDGQSVDVLLMYADLDGLKTINDRLGHEAGDAAIAAIADVLRRAFRASDVVARLGGDEFAVLALDVSADAEEQIERRVAYHLDAYNAGRPPEARLSVSVGFVRQSLAAGASLDALLSQGDALMYAQKVKRARARATSAEA
jgi:diguanylate cyclase (GGDEF)-like protein